MIRRTMNYNEFLTDIKTHIAQTLDDNVRVMVQTVVKNNNMQLDGLVIVRPDCNISPTIYLNPYYHRFLDGVPMDDIYTDILSAYQRHLPKQDFDASFFFDYHKIRPRVIPKLINYEKNKALLEELPHTRILDLAVVFQYLVSTGRDEHASILIHNNHMDYWNATDKDLLEAALHNAPLLLPSRFDSLSELLLTDPSGFPSEESGSDNMIPMYVLTNSRRINGASAMLYSGILAQLAKRFGQNLVILPSSVHEVLILPTAEQDCSADAMSGFTDMVREVNETQVSDDEFLSNHVYLYVKDEDTIRIF